MSILSSSELIDAILALEITSPLHPGQVPKELQIQLMNLYPQNFSQNQISFMKNEIANGVNPFQAYQNARFNFHFNPEILLQIFNQPKFIEKEPQLASNIILFSLLTWVGFHLNLDTSEYLSMLFELLKLLANIVKSDVNLLTIVISAIYHLLLVILPKHMEDFDISKKIETVDGIISSVPNIPDQFYDIFAKITNVFEDRIATIPEYGQNLFISFVAKMIKQLTVKFPKQAIDSLVPTVCKKISDLEKTAIEYVAAISKAYGNSDISNYLPLMLMAFISNIQSNSVMGKVDKSKLSEALVLSINTENNQHKIHSIRSTIDISDSYNASHPLDFKTIPVSFPDNKVKLESLISPKLIEIIELIGSTFAGNADVASKLLSLFYPYFYKEGDLRKSYDAHAFLILLINKFKTLPYPLNKEIITDELIFDPRITVFNQTDNFSMINTLRNKALELLIGANIMILYEFMMNSVQYPLLYAELLYRLTFFMNKIKMVKGLVSIYYKLLLEANIYYKNMTGLDENDLLSVKKAQYAIFFIFEKLSRNDRVIVQFFNDEVFMSAFAPLIFEKPLQHLITQIIKRYTTKNYIEENSVFKRKFNQVFEEVFQNLDDLLCISSCLYLFDFFNNFLSHNENVLKMLESIVSSLCFGILKLPVHDSSKKFLSSVLLFLTYETKNHRLKSQEVGAIQATISKLYGNNLPENIFKQLIQLAAGNPDQSIETSFKIEQPKAITILLLVSINSPQYVENVLDILSHLCNYSEENKLLIHRNEVDLVLLDMVEKMKENSNRSEQLLNKILEIFSMVASYSSSVTVVQRFISLLCLVEGKFLPWFYEIIINTFHSLVSKKIEQHNESIPFNAASVFEINKLNYEHLSNGFTFCCWVYSNTSMPEYILHLLTLTDSRRQNISIYMTWKSLSIRILGKENFEPEYIMPTREWTMVSIVFDNVPDSDITYIKVFNNKTLIAEERVSFRFEKGNISCAVSGTLPGSKDPDQPSCSAQFSLYPVLQAEQISQLFQNGYNFAKNDYNPIFIFIPYEPVDTIVIRNIAKNSSIYSKTEIQALHPSSFPDVLCKRCGADLLIPIFAQWDIKFEDGHEMEKFSNKSFSILRRVLLRNFETQKSFADSHGFEIISYFLLTTHPKHITLDLYKFIYKLLFSIQNKELKKQLFTYVLTNVEIWIRMPEKDNILILEQWVKHLFPKNPGLNHTNRNFSWVLNLMRIYYYSEHNEIDIQFSREQEYTKINFIRKILIQLAVDIASLSFTSSDLFYLICVICNCSSISEKLDYLLILKKLIHKRETSPLSHATDSFKYIHLLQYLINSKENNVIKDSMLALVSTLRDNYFQNITPDMEFDIILHQIPAEMVTDQYFEIFLEGAMDKIPEYFSIAAWMAFNLGVESVKKLYSSLQPKQCYVSHCSWCIWPILTMFKYMYPDKFVDDMNEFNNFEEFSSLISSPDKNESKNNENTTAIDEKTVRMIASFIIRCSFLHFDYIYGVVDLIGNCVNSDSDDMKKIILEEFWKALMSSTPDILEANIKIYYQCARHFLFYRTEISGEKRIQRILKDSIFAENEIEYSEFTFYDKVMRIRPRFLDENDNRYSPSLAEKAYSSFTQANDEVSMSPTGAQGEPRRRNKRLGRRSSRFSIVSLNELFNAGSGSALAEDNSDRRRRRGNNGSGSNEIYLGNDTAVIFKDISENKIIYHFGLRENKDGTWKDVDIAINFINTFQMKKLQEFATTVIMICSFLLPSNPDISLKAIHMFNLKSPDLFDALSFYEKNLIRFKKQRIFKNTPVSEILFHSNEFLTSFSSSHDDESLSNKWSKVINWIQNYENNNSALAHSTYELASTVSNTVSDFVADFNDEVNKFKTNASKFWQQLWHSFTIERAPWHKSLPPNMLQQVHYKRESTHCWAYFTPKLKQNLQFDWHIEASLVRDTGNEVDAQQKLEEFKEELKYIYEISDPSPLFQITEETIKKESNNSFTTSNCIIELPCELIKLNKIYQDASFALMKDCIVITIPDKKTFVINNENVSRVFPRTRFHHLTAIEIFTYEGSSFLLNFPNINSAEVLKSFKNTIKTVVPTDFKQAMAQSKLTERWQRKEISNFQYLMYLNIYSGRTANDISQYPVFPWILQDYTSEKLDLNDDSIYRDLSKPVGALNQERLDELIEKQEQLQQLGMVPYLYSSNYSCPLSVCLYMLRLEPFTTMHIDIQGGRFDVPSRLFSSISDTFNLVNNTHNDFRELIPEFFVSYEFLQNRDRFNLGKTDTGRVDDVVLPPWAHDNPVEFIYLHRKALESEYVSKNLHNWIDLIWGDKQSGDKAKAANNVFMHEMYPTIWNETSLNDVDTRINVEAILCHIGQIPQQLFDKPHPQVHNAPKQNIENGKSKTVSLPLTESIIMVEIISSERIATIYTVDENYQPKQFKFDPNDIFAQKVILPNVAQTPTATRPRSNSPAPPTHPYIPGQQMPTNQQIPPPPPHNTTPIPQIPHSSSSNFAPSRPQPIKKFIGNSIRQFSRPRDLSSESNKTNNSKNPGTSSANSKNLPVNPLGGPGPLRMVRNNSFSGLSTIVAQKESTKTIVAFNKTGAFDVVNENLHELFRIETEMELRVKHRSEITTIASDDKCTAVADKDSVVSLYIGKTQKFSIPLFTSSVKCLAISSTFHLLVCGTKDGFLLFCSLNSGFVTKTVNLCKMRPLSILITPSWGFVAVYMTELAKGEMNHFIKLYTVNGDFIRSIPIHFPVTTWNSFNTVSGFDYIVLANNSNKVYLFEAFYLNIGEPVYSSDFPVSALSYIINESCLVIASTKGKLTFCYQALPE